MNNTLIIALASLGGVLWLIATIRDRFKNATGGMSWNHVRNMFSVKKAESGVLNEVMVNESAPVEVTIESLERELGIEPDHYLCDRIARINEALIARRDGMKNASKKGAAK